MPKRVETTMSDGSLTVDNEIITDSNGLILNYNNYKYDYNGNVALVSFINGKGTVGLDNSNASSHYTTSAKIMTEEKGSEAVL